MSGRGLGFTGGTVDKLESIPGYRTSLSSDEFLDNVRKCGIAVTGQSGNLAPADKKLYALRDVTGTVSSIPLIASSIMSKKIASGADKILLDVKFGSGAFMKTVEEAEKLAQAMVAIGELVERETRAVLSSMEEPLGKQIGNSLEVEEAVQILRGKKDGHLKQVCYVLAGNMLHMAGIVPSVRAAYPVLDSLIQSGKAMEKFREFVIAQGGKTAFIEDLSILPQASYQMEVLSEKEGYITTMDTHQIGMCASLLGAGRMKKGDAIDLSAGLIMHVGLGDWVRRGDRLAVLYTNKKEALIDASTLLRDAIKMSEHSVKKGRLIYGIVDKNGLHTE
jgi:pyrimidine-nucleoside phosphorylase